MKNSKCSVTHTQISICICCCFPLRMCLHRLEHQNLSKNPKYSRTQSQPHSELSLVSPAHAQELGTAAPARSSAPGAPVVLGGCHPSASTRSQETTPRRAPEPQPPLAQRAPASPAPQWQQGDPGNASPGNHHIPPWAGAVAILLCPKSCTLLPSPPSLQAHPAWLSSQADPQILWAGSGLIHLISCPTTTPLGQESHLSTHRVWDTFKVRSNH